MKANEPLNVAVCMTFPAPYRIPLLNRMNKLPGIRVTGLFSTTHFRGRNEAIAKFEFSYKLFNTNLLLTRNRYGDPVGFVFSPGLWWHLARSRYDVLVTLGWTIPDTFLARAIGKLKRTPTILWDESIPHAPGAFKQCLQPLLSRYFGSFDAYLAASDWCREYMLSMGARADRVTVFPQVVDNQFFHQEALRLRAQRETLKRTFGIATTRTILYVGQLISRKGVDTLLDAFELVAARDADVSLVMVGDGVLRAALQARRAASAFRERIFIQSFASQAELPAYYALADLFVLPSQYDTFGVVVNEAMASGLPVIATSRVGATGNLVQDYINGRVIPPGDAVQLAEAMLFMLADDARRSEMGELAWARIQQWTIEDAAQAFQKCLALCIASDKQSTPQVMELR